MCAEVPAAFDGGRAHAQVRQRSLGQMLRTLQELDPHPLWQPRPPGRRMAATCRHFCLLLAAALRQRGIPVRWQKVDAQLDPSQCQALGVSFDPCDLPCGCLSLCR